MWLNGKTNFQLKSLSNLTDWHFNNPLGSGIDHGKDIGHTRYHTDVSEHQILAWNIKSSQIDLILNISWLQWPQYMQFQLRPCINYWETYSCYEISFSRRPCLVRAHYHRLTFNHSYYYHYVTHQAHLSKRLCIPPWGQLMTIKDWIS